MQVRGLVIGGTGAFRADGRSQFGCRQLVSQISYTKEGQETHFPVYFWPFRKSDAVTLLESFLHAKSG